MYEKGALSKKFWIQKWASKFFLKKPNCHTTHCKAVRRCSGVVKQYFFTDLKFKIKKNNRKGYRLSQMKKSDKRMNDKAEAD